MTPDAKSEREEQKNERGSRWGHTLVFLFALASSTNVVSRKPNIAMGSDLIAGRYGFQFTIFKIKRFSSFFEIKHLNAVAFEVDRRHGLNTFGVKMGQIARGKNFKTYFNFLAFVTS